MTARAPQPRPSSPPLPRQPRRGVALVMVVMVVALATVLGYVMLSTATLQHHAGSNQTKLLSADYLAESGLNIAMYYLQYPAQAPALNAAGHWAGMNGEYTLPNGSPASLSVTVTQVMDDTVVPAEAVPWLYEIAASASVGSSTDPSHRVTRTSGARVFVQTESVMRPGALVVNSTLPLNGPVTVYGDVYAPKTMSMKAAAPAATVYGYGYAPTPFMTSYPTYKQPTKLYAPISNPTAGAAIAPTNDDVNRYTTYKVDGEPYDADGDDDGDGLLGSILSGVLGLITVAPTEENPAGVIYKEGTYELQDNVTINGTLVVEGNLLVKGANITINPQPGFPALIVTGNLEIYQQGKSLTSNGLTYVGGQLRSNNNGLLSIVTPSTFTVNGQLLIGTTGVSPQPTTPIMTGYNVKTTLTYNAAKATAPDISSEFRTPTGVTIVRWGLP